ncbi:chitinase [Metarhizium album ARSEF 1941]|uniref:Chitinase n=1 Tax=Metarhizium album (strain ARSEF 1941) TaxID=1081103 RepID=A0A0B2WK98_METAS|nr:chitinase [Metarhizium album ARSEF 1941]KHN94104.1 chitinase [Metarhizium album ARSEF 1941]
MKISIFAHLTFGAAAAFAGSASVCPKVNSHASGAGLQKILDYRKSDHQIMAAYFRSWRDIASNPDVNKVSMNDLPDCLDIAFVFPEGSETDAFYTALKEKYVPTLRGRGTKVVRSINVGELLNSNYSNTPAGYQKLAEHILQTFVTVYDLDGLDVDVERDLYGSQLEQATGVFEALSKSLGPRSKTGKLLIYDTNRDGDTPLFQAVNSTIDYVLVQSYGRDPSSTQHTFDTYKPYITGQQYLIGFSFYEEHGADWGDAVAPMQTSRAYQYAQWQPAGGRKGGIFSYAVDRDGVPPGDDAIVPTDFSWTRGLISAMNP